MNFITGAKFLVYAGARTGALRQVTRAREVLRPAPALVRHFGLIDNLTARTEKMKEDKKEKLRAQMFEAQVNFMKSVEKYGMREHVKQLEDSAVASGLEGWKAKLRSAKEEEELKRQFSDYYVSKHLTIELANLAGVDVAVVNRFLNTYEQTRGIHRWIQSRLQRRLSVPTSQNAFELAIAADRKFAPTTAQRKRQTRHRRPMR